MPRGPVQPLSERAILRRPRDRRGAPAVPCGAASRTRSRSPDEVSDDAAAVVETISVSLWGGHRGNIEPGHSVLVTGSGPIGLFAIQVARHPGRRPRRGRGASGVATRVGGTPRRGDRRGALGRESGRSTCYMECTGVEDVRHDAALLVVPGGRAVFIGVGLQAALRADAGSHRAGGQHRRRHALPVHLAGGHQRHRQRASTWSTTWSPAGCPSRTRSRRGPDKEYFATEVKTIIRVNE